MLIFSVCDARVRRNTWPAAEEIEIEKGRAGAATSAINFYE